MVAEGVCVEPDTQLDHTPGDQFESTEVEPAIPTWSKFKQVFGSASSLRGQLFRGAGASIALKIADSVLGLLLSLVLARVLQPEGYGTYSFALSVVGILGMPVMMGLPTLVLREVARDRASGEWARIRGILTRATQFVLIMSALVIPVAVFVILAWHERLGKVQADALLWALILLPLMGLNRLREAALLGFGNVFHALAPERLLLPTAMIALLGFYGAFGRVGPPAAIALYGGASCLTFLLGVRFLLRSLPTEVLAAQPQYNNASWLRSMLPLSLLAGLNVLMSQTDIFMLGVLSTKEEVGLYRVAYSGGALVLFFYIALNIVLTPHVAALHKSGDMDRLQRLIITATRSTTAGALPVVTALGFLGGPILELIYGSPYRPAYIALAILACAQFFNVLTGDVYGVLNMTGHERETLKVVVVGAVLNVGLNAALIPRFGSAGAAAATAVAIVMSNCALVWILWTKTGLWSPAFGYLMIVGRRE